MIQKNKVSVLKRLSLELTEYQKCVKKPEKSNFHLIQTKVSELVELSGGTCKLFANQVQYDLSIKDGKGEEVIAMEFKLHQDPLSANDLEIILNKIYKHSTCRIGFIVAVNFAAALKKKEDWKGLSPNYSIYSLARVKKNKQTHWDFLGTFLSSMEPVLKIKNGSLS